MKINSTHKKTVILSENTDISKLIENERDINGLSFKLDFGSIDLLSSILHTLLDKHGFENKNIHRIVLSTEDVLTIWSEAFGKDAICTISIEQHFGRTSLALCIPGVPVDPTTYSEETISEVLNAPNLYSLIGLISEYRYSNCKNELRISLQPLMPRKKHILPIMIITGIVLGLLFRFVVPDIGNPLYSFVLSPISSTINRILRLIAGPLIFLSVVAGIVSQKDISSFSSVGKNLFKQIILKSFLFGALTIIILVPFFKIDISNFSLSANDCSGLLDVVLNIIPENIICPFETGNGLQVLFLAVCLGICCVALSGSVKEFSTIIMQGNSLIQYMMAFVAKFIPILVFLAVFQLVFTADSYSLQTILYPFLSIHIISLLFIIGNVCCTACDLKTPILRFIKQLFPTFIIAFSTASSFAAYDTNLSCCEKELRIDKRITQFGLPFGQTVYKPGSILILIVLCIFMADSFGTSITPLWLLTLLFVVVLAASASPPVPGGLLSVVTVVFSQLSVPDTAISQALLILVFADYICTATNISLLQLELCHVAKKLDLFTSSN